MEKKKVLLVDDEKLFLKSVTDGLKPYQATYGFEVLSALNGQEAIGILGDHSIDAVITDIRMPEADGFRLISHLINNFPSIPVVVMTAFGSQEIEKKVRELGIVRYLEKPIDFDVLLSTIRDLLSIEKKGRIEGINISTFLQMMEMEKITCTLTITSNEQQGFLYLRSGELLEAETQKHKGMDAAIEILTWTDVKIDMMETCKLKEGSIKKSLTAILLDSFRILDERGNDTDSSSSLELPLPEKPADAGKEPVKKHIMDDTKKFKTPSIKVDIQKMNLAIETLQKDIGDALLSTDIYFTEDAQSVVGVKSNPAACAVFSQVTRKIGESLNELKYPPLGRYYLLDLDKDRIVIIIPIAKFQWAMLIDSSRIQLGMLLNLAIPKAIGIFEEALTS